VLLKGIHEINKIIKKWPCLASLLLLIVPSKSMSAVVKLCPSVALIFLFGADLSVCFVVEGLGLNEGGVKRGCSPECCANTPTDRLSGDRRKHHASPSVHVRLRAKD